ncbi:hypothetical protein AL755_21215 [Arthrobacter sp. ERGS1:01]|uniref:ABC transporter ATP-binding protein n=1 Tax=Arthrobacter sp. ERGS1:01 TaxID=1704044 RepID=UPI0006CB37B7|nr:ABC transporter ATP-binding protein [Arthrobacter sp. ERGS1:01]ALE07414.1 hypothetical protein AL755_21215 [Arthrobacter sp. ERGS1:01]
MHSQEKDIEVSDLRKVYAGGVVGLDRISLNIKKGSYFSLLGPSGCGKSTLLRILSGLEEPTAGTVKIRNEPIRAASGRQRATNLVFQRLALFPQMTVAKNIAFGPKVHGKSRAEIKRIVAEKLELVELSAMANRYPHQISGGQQQRVAIARALANEPAVLLLDEPLSSLDFKLRVQMQHALKKIQKNSGTTFVYVTHDQLEAFTMSDEIAVMSAGKVEQVGSPLEIYNNPATEFVATFVGDTNVFRGEMKDGRFHTEGLAVDLDEPGRVITVRPEFVSLFEGAAPEAPNRFDGTISEITFGGSRIRYEIRLAGGRTVLSERPTDASFLPIVGQRIKFGWTSGSAVILAH